jgi:hypothetical protein
MVMVGSAGIPRYRGVACGLLLILLGAWAALVPFIGPYFHFAYASDRTWHYTTSRLYLDILPGVAAVIGGFFVLVTKSRAAGALFAFLAALGGGWLVTGQAIVNQIVRNGSISAGNPVVPVNLGPTAASQRIFLEGLGFFTGTGLLIVFFAALAMGRFTVRGGAPNGAHWNGEDSGTDSYPASSAYPAGGYSSMPGQYDPGDAAGSSAETVAPHADTPTQAGYHPSEFPHSGGYGQETATTQMPQSGGPAQDFSGHDQDTTTGELPAVSGSTAAERANSGPPAEHFPPQTYPGPSPTGQYPPPSRPRPSDTGRIEF